MSIPIDAHGSGVWAAASRALLDGKQKGDRGATCHQGQGLDSCLCGSGRIAKPDEKALAGTVTPLAAIAAVAT